MNHGCRPIQNAGWPDAVGGRMIIMLGYALLGVVSRRGRERLDCSYDWW